MHLPPLSIGIGDRYHAALQMHADVVSRNVGANLLDRHLRPLFGSLLRDCCVTGSE